MHIKAMLIIVIALAFSVPAKAYYQPQEGRFMQRDPLGVNPAGGKHNPFALRKQYKDSVNLYEYVKSSPMLLKDPIGTCVTASCTYPESINKLPFPMELPGGDGDVFGWFNSHWKLSMEVKQCSGGCFSLAVTSCVHESVIAYWEGAPNVNEVLRHEMHHKRMSIQAFDKAVRRFHRIAQKCPCGIACHCSSNKANCYMGAADSFKTAYSTLAEYYHAAFDCSVYEDDAPNKQRRCKQAEDYLDQYVNENAQAEKKLYECDRTL